NEKIITLEKLERELNKMNDEQSDRLSDIERKMMTLQHLKRDTEDNEDDRSKSFPANDQKMVLVDLVREIKSMYGEQTDRFSNIEWTNCTLDGDLQNLRKALDQEVEAIYTRLELGKEIENEKMTA